MALTLFRYAISSFLAIPEKATLSSSYLLPCLAPKGEKDLAITFTSASSIPAALPSTVACGFGWPALKLGVEGVNSRVGRWLLGQLGGEAPLQDLLGQEDWDVVDIEAGQASANSTAAEEIRLRGWVFMDFCDEPEGQYIVQLPQSLYLRCGQVWGSSLCLSRPIGEDANQERRAGIDCAWQ